jgi:CheY-like chemotaxis protein
MPGGSTTIDRTGAFRRRARIVVADSDEVSLDWMVRGLRRDGHVVLAARDGVELLERLAGLLLEDATVDLVITELRMPGWSGLQVLAGLRAVDWPTPIILVTGPASSRALARAERLASAVLRKPFDLVDLRTLALTLLPGQPPGPRCYNRRPWTSTEPLSASSAPPAP